MTFKETHNVRGGGGGRGGLWLGLEAGRVFGDGNQQQQQQNSNKRNTSGVSNAISGLVLW